MAYVASIPDKYIEMAIEVSGKANPKEAILYIIEEYYKLKKGQVKEVKFQTAQEIKKKDEAVIKRAKAYRNKIIQQNGYVTEDDLKKIAKKFKVDVEDLWDDLIMKEPGKYYPLE